MPDKKPQTLILIAGPTASGKSALAVEMAQSLDGEIVNADAIQVYADLQVLSARPGQAEMAAAPHHLFGVLDGAERCSAGRWARMAAAALSDIASRGKPAIIVGGTGLYFRALTEGLSEIPDIPDGIREKARTRRGALGPQAFYEEVVARDPAMARLNPADAQRCLRAWEVFEATGEPLSSFQNRTSAPIAPQSRARVILAPQRETLYERCDARFEKMLERGALDEAQRLRARGLDLSLPVMKALGLAELIAHLDGGVSLEDAITLAKRNTRRFAKRQLTWFRNQTADWPVAEDAGAAHNFLRSALNNASL